MGWHNQLIRNLIPPIKKIKRRYIECKNCKNKTYLFPSDREGHILLCENCEEKIKVENKRIRIEVVNEIDLQR